MRKDGGVPLANILSPHFPSRICEPLRGIDMSMLWETSGVELRHREQMVDNPVGPWKSTLDRFVPCLGTGLLIGVIGNRGTGKTQLAAHLIRSVLSSFNGKESNGGPPRMCRAMDFFLDVRACFKQGSAQAERDAIRVYTGPCFLAIDEMHERGESPWEDRLLNYLIDVRYGQKRDTVLISNQTEQVFLKQLGASIVDRMRECGGIVTCTWPSFRGQKIQ